MTNAKSRLVRVIALALAVLMIVPMALVGCKKTDDTPAVDQAAIDAAIKEALDAAQKAQDAADKAAQDAKDAQDKLAASEKEAADLQAQIDAMKNTTATAAPATTTQAPVAEDTTVVDAYIASVVLDAESDFNKLIAKYVDKDGNLVGIAKSYLGANTDPISADAKVIADTIATAKIAIQRAQTVDYVNALVAKLAADLDAIPTISERVKAAYDAIDFASDEDIVDVAYANKLLAEAIGLVKNDETKPEIKEFYEAEAKALKAFGEDELNLTKLITDEYARYADVNDGLYGEVFAYAKKDLIEKIEKLFGKENDELDVKKIVYGGDANEDAIEAIEDLYDEFYKLYKKEYAALQDAFEIAVIGEAYLLKAEGNYLREKLAAAAERVAELEAAVAEFKANKVFTNKNTGIVAIVDAYAKGYGDEAKGEDFIFNAKTNAKIVAIDEALAAWMAKYSFDAKDDNLDAILDTDEVKNVYDTFVVVKATMNLINEWAAKLDAIKASDIEDAKDALTKDAAVVIFVDDKDTDDETDDVKYEVKYFDYAENGAAVEALYTWYEGTYKLNKEKEVESNKDSVKHASVKVEETVIKIDAANIAAMLDEALEITVADIKNTFAPALEVFKGEKLVTGKFTVNAKEFDSIFAQIKAIEKAADKLELDAIETDDLAAMADVVDMITALCTFLALEGDEDAEFEYATDSKNYDVVPFDTLAAINAAKDALVGDLLAKAAEIVKAYIGWKGEYDEDDEAVKFGGKLYDVDVVEISAYSYALVSKLAADYKAIKIFDLDETIKIEDIEEDEQTFTADQVVDYYRQINDAFYYNIMNKIHKVACDELRNSAIVDAAIADANLWRAYKAAEDATLAEYEKTYGEFGLNYVYPTSSSNVGKEAGDINVYKTAKEVDGKTYVKAILAVDPAKYATKNADRTAVIAFDVAAYKAAVDASIASYRAAWYTKYLATSANYTAISELYENVIDNVISYKLWTIEGEFEMNDEAYTFVVNADYTVTVYDDADDEVATVKDADEIEYTISAVLENNKVVLVTDKKDAEDKVLTLADVDDDATADAPKYEYALADGIAEIAANSKAIGTVYKADAPTSTYVVYSEAWLNALQDALTTNAFYKYRDDVLADVKADYINKAGVSDAIKNLANEFVGEWKDVKHNKATYEQIDVAYKALESQIAKLGE